MLRRMIAESAFVTASVSVSRTIPANLRWVKTGGRKRGIPRPENPTGRPPYPVGGDISRVERFTGLVLPPYLFDERIGRPRLPVDADLFWLDARRS